jgi:hypothetical protein
MGLILVTAIGVLLYVLYSIAAGFSELGLADRAHALALPDGSVRALIALFLIMIFVFMGVYLFRSVAGQPGGTLPNLTAEQVVALGNQVMSVDPNPPQPDQANTFNVTLRSGITPTGEQLALQLATILGTLVTAVSAFYFGSSTATSALGAGGSSPTALTLEKVSPNSLQSESRQTFTLTGTGFTPGMRVKLSQSGKDDITAQDVEVVNSSTIRATFDLNTTNKGSWDVVLLKPDGSVAASLPGLVIC